jgi:hypothetical protein
VPHTDEHWLLAAFANGVSMTGPRRVVIPLLTFVPRLPEE